MEPFAALTLIYMSQQIGAEPVSAAVIPVPTMEQCEILAEEAKVYIYMEDPTAEIFAFCNEVTPNGR